MLETFKVLIANQFEAAFCTVGACVDRCPDKAWDEPICHVKFCQVAFHVLFYADFYVGASEEEFRRQAFHRSNAGFFRDYEELEDRSPVQVYDKPSIRSYLTYCREKARHHAAAETEESLSGSCGFPRKTFSRAELHVYNIRHLQHHAAQMSLRLRIDFDLDVPWYGSGWRDG